MISKDALVETIEQNKDEIYTLGQELFAHPQLGYKEFDNRKILIDYFKNHGLTIDQTFAITGFSVTIGKGKPHIGLLAELDAIPTPGHPYATNSDHAAHACGHSSQCAIMANALVHIHESGLLNDLNGSITLYFTPAEEYVDLPYRRQLIKEDKIKYISGKQNMIADHQFDDCDVIIHCHAMGDSPYKYCVNTTMSGFIYKEFDFIGVESHAGAAPYLGKNALNMMALFLDAVGMLRETFREEDIVRFHGMCTNGGHSINSIPALATYCAYLRCFNWEKMNEINQKIDDAAIYCAKALGGSCEIRTDNGYLPFHQDKRLSQVVYENMLDLVHADEINTAEKSIASGDVGDLGCLKPTIQFGYNGFTGRIHGKDLCESDPYRIYIEPTRIVVATLYDLLSKPELVEDITAHFKPTLTYDQYMDYLNGKPL